jgi:hypothetical protein
MKIKTTSTFTIESEEAAALGTIVDLLNEMMEECDEYVDSDLFIGDTPIPFSTLNETAQFLDYLWAVGSASVSTANYEDEDEPIHFDSAFEMGEEEYERACLAADNV